MWLIPGLVTGGVTSEIGARALWSTTPPAHEAAPAPRAERGPPRILLTPTGAVPSASGVVTLVPARSPFAVAVTADGRLVYELDIAVDGLGDAAQLGAYTTFVAWVATPNVDQIVKLGAVRSGQRLVARADLNKFIIMVTAEPSAAVAKRSGPVILRGISPSGLLQSFRGHALFEAPPG